MTRSKKIPDGAILSPYFEEICRHVCDEASLKAVANVSDCDGMASRDHGMKLGNRRGTISPGDLMRLCRAATGASSPDGLANAGNGL